jgi:hypothetical protein
MIKAPDWQTLLRPFCVWQLGSEERANSNQTQNTVTSSSAERSLLKAETE